MAGGFSQVDALVGATQINVNGLPVDAAPGRMQPGMIIAATDNWWGTGEFVYCRFAGTVRTQALVVITPVFDTALNAWRFDAVEAPNTANLGKMIGVAKLAGTLDQYGWVQVSGITPVLSNATIAADTAFGIVAQGQVGANSAGKQILNARIIGSAATTVAKTSATANAGQPFITISDASGWFQGAFLSGTGIAAGAKINAIDASGRQVSMSAVSSALVNGTVTATYNDATVFYNVAFLNRSFAQGAVT